MPSQPMNRLILCCALLGASPWALAQGVGVDKRPDPITAPVAGSPSKDDSLYVAFGGKAGLDKIALDLVDRSKADPRILKFFKDANAQGLADSLSEQFCFLLGGPCKYEGATMAKAHKDMGIGRSDFNALVENLQDALDAAKIPFTVQNKLLALLAPMHRDVVEKP